VMNAISQLIRRQPSALILMLSALTLVFTLSAVAAQNVRAPQISTSVAELVFAGVINRTSIPTQQIVIENTGDQVLIISNISKQTANTGAFTLSGLPAFPANVNPGNTITVNVGFVPGNSQGRLSTTVVIDASNAADVTVPVFGLSAAGLEGSNEPPLDSVVKTLGFNINVGFTSLTSNTNSFPIGDEVIRPLFVKAGAGNVMLRPVGRYSPERDIEFGYYFPNGNDPIENEIAVILDSVSESVQYPPNHQTLNPKVDGTLTFDPGSAQFGVYVEGLSDRLTYTEDALNGSDPIDSGHAVRIYPLKNRAGVLVPNSYLIGFEDASNGDYQDYMFVLSNVKDPNAPTPTNTPTDTPPTDIPPTDTPQPPTLTPLTTTPIPPTEATNTPELPATATETPVEATVTGTPPTATLPPQRTVELLLNNSFEFDLDSNNLPDTWKVKYAVRDKLKCDKPEAGKFFAHSGSCAFMFKPESVEATRLVQKPGVEVVNEDVEGRLLVSAYTQSPTAGTVRIKLVVKYLDPSVEKDKLVLDVPASDVYVQTLNNVPVNQQVAKAKVIIANETTAGKVLLDDASLLWQSGPVDEVAPAPIPLP
jgi:hypothetical protein